MFYFLLDFEAKIQGMAEVDEQTIVYITLEALLQISDTVNSIYVRSHLSISRSLLGDLHPIRSQPRTYACIS